MPERTRASWKTLPDPAGLSTDMGIARRALRDAIDLVRDRTRNYYHGTTGKAADEPVILAAIGTQPPLGVCF